MSFLTTGDPDKEHHAAQKMSWEDLGGANRREETTNLPGPLVPSPSFSPAGHSFPTKSFFLCLFRAAPTAYGSSQARSQIRAEAAGLCHSHRTPDLRCICNLHHNSQQHWKDNLFCVQLLILCYRTLVRALLTLVFFVFV